jgi:hypothetical protein
VKRTILVMTIAAAAMCVSCATVPGKLKYVELHTRECNICNRNIPMIEAIQAKYNGIVDIDSYGSNSDTGEDLVEQYGVKKYPSNLFMDSKGVLFFRYDGLLDQKAVEEIIEKKLKADAVTETAK